LFLLFIKQEQENRKAMRERLDKFMKASFWIAGAILGVFVLALLIQGTRKGERKAKLSSRDFGVINQIELDQSVLDAVITNVRVLYVVATDDGMPKDNLARYYCDVAKKNHALIEAVRVVEADSTNASDNKGKPDFELLAECNCSALRVR
jgi:hypothetical protein